MTKTAQDKSRWVHAGMYAITFAHQQAWRQWFKAFVKVSELEAPLEFGHGQTDDTYLAEDLFMAQTCGYPLVKKWSATHYPIAVATFNVEGCNKGQYCSWFVCSKSDPRQRLEQFKNSTVTINSSDSNSGYNVLRYAVSQLNNFEASKPYFKQALQSGSHWNSLLLIADGKADLAAIDSVSYALALQQNPELATNLKTVGRSEYSMGLPFIAPKSLTLSTKKIALKMNEAVHVMDNHSRDLLFLTGFVPTIFEDYQSIKEIELAAICKGYDQLT